MSKEGNLLVSCPNPASDKIIVELTSSDAQISLFSIKGGNGKLFAYYHLTVEGKIFSSNRVCINTVCKLASVYQ